MLILRKILLYDVVYYALVILSLIYFTIFNLLPHPSIYTGKEKNLTATVSDYYMDGDYLRLDLKTKEKLIATYHFNSLEEKNYYTKTLQIGMELSLKIELNQPLNNTIPNTFNYKKYLNNNKIYWLGKVKELSVTNKKVSLFYKLKNSIKLRINSLNKSSSYVDAFILGDKRSIEGMSNYQKNGASHLFALSGMHVGLFTGFILFVLKKFKVRENKRYLTAIVFIAFYGLLTGLSPSLLRAGVFFILLSLNKIFYTEIKPLNLLLLSGTILTFTNPLLLYDIGFQYSFIITFGLILIRKSLTKNYFLNLFLISVVAFLFSIPISLNNFYELNILSIINNLIFVPLVSLIIYPLSLIVFVFPFLDNILYFFINFSEYLNTFLASIKIFTVIIPKLSFFFTIIYYLLLIVLIVKKKYLNLILILLLLIFIKYQSKFDASAYVYFLDVGQGDSALIVRPYKKEVIMVDTGGTLEFAKEDWQLRKTTYNKSTNTIIFLKSIGINKINYLILSHGDVDHVGESLNIIENFKVDNIIMNNGYYSTEEQWIINNTKIPIYQGVFPESLNVYSLNNITYDNENDNSLVLLFDLYNYKLLFMGDASKKTENSLPHVKADLIKLAHHGSKTSSDESFLYSINPSIAIISAGRGNLYHHPSSSTLDSLKKLNIDYYNTQSEGTITLTINKKTHTFSTSPP